MSKKFMLILEVGREGRLELERNIQKEFKSRRDALEFMFKIEEEVEKRDDLFIAHYKVFELLKCDCGNEVALTDFTNTCRCGSDYNMSGSKLAPREQWGEETGEHWTDCY